MKTIFSLSFIALLLVSLSAFPQASSTSHAGTTGDWCGWDNTTTINLNIEHQGTKNIDFYTGATQRMTILGTAATNPGFVGIGPSFTAPTFLLDVKGGDINVNTVANGYRINSDYVLWHNGIKSNIFVGVGAGAVNAAADNTFVGRDAGLSNNTSDNTFIGFEAGMSSVTNSSNTYVGALSGRLSDGGENAFLGYASGANNLTGNGNTFIGFGSGFNNDYGLENTFVGTASGPTNNSGRENTFVGFTAGTGIVTGARNVALGDGAGFNVGWQDYSIAIGYGVQSMNSHDCIIGDNLAEVGLRLSGDATGPTSVLDINGDLNVRTVANDNTLTRFLVIDPTINNKVRYRDLASFSPFGLCSSGVIPPLTGHSAMDMNGSNLYFDGQHPTADRIGIGYGCGSGLIGKLNVMQSNSTGVGFSFVSLATSPSTFINVGTASLANTAPTNIGGYFIGGPAPAFTASGYDIGVIGAVDATITGGVVKSIGVYGEAGGAPIGHGQDLWAGYFNGYVCVTGGGPFVISDSIFKTNVNPLLPSDALDLIEDLQPHTYDFDHTGYPSISFPAGTEYGLISQEVQRVIPSLVKGAVHPEYQDNTGATIYNDQPYLAMNYTGLVPILVGAVQELATVATPGDVSGAVQFNNAGTFGGDAGTFYWDNASKFLGIGTNTPSAPLQVQNYLNFGDIGDLNTFMGYQAGQAYTYGFSQYNTGIGAYALTSNTTGTHNTAIGYNTLYNNTTGLANTAVGFEALLNNTTGQINTATGTFALNANTTGFANTATGEGALYNNTTGSYNVALGYGAGLAGATDNNTVNIGYLSATSASDEAIIGNTSMTSIGGQVNWTAISDVRVKDNVQENVPGLKFINQLRPVTYHYNIDKEKELLGVKQMDTVNWPTKNNIEKIQFTGFIAQEVDAAARKVNFDFSGVDKKENIWGLRYAEFVVPLVKSVQQLDSINNSLLQRITLLEQKLQTVPTAQPANGQSQVSHQAVELTGDAIILDQNSPNPFSEQTTITYYIPQEVGAAQIIFYRTDGNIMRTVNIESKGAGSLTVYASNLSSGMYTYSLIADGKLIDTKKMTCQK